ncbi:MAG: LuxR C-terminal-related transcriptional regulator [Oscillospiraceae bacterium]|nr:LuxR C-terminal-related transcriptional regulator [Oscillospiraceae bacterium]
MERTEPGWAAPRTHLMELLDGASVKRLMYIHAPAGYGKTLSTRLWLGRRGGRAAWIAVSESLGRKPAEFCERLAGALCVLQPDNAALAEVVTHKSFSAASFEFLERALHLFRLSAREEDVCTLVIDDLHRITSPDILQYLPELIFGLPESVTSCILSRAAPPDSFSGLVVKDAIEIVGADPLKFSEPEIRAFFNARGQPLTLRQTRDIMAATDGWVIGLNAILLAGKYQTERKLLAGYLETYVREQIWERWDEERRDFLLRVSVEEELTPEFCDAMTGRRDSADILDALVRENAFISVDRENVYRFHHLFLDFLRHTLERGNDRRKAEFHQKAGGWFYSRGDYYRAVEHYIQCGSKSGIAKGVKAMYDYTSPYISVENTVLIIHLSIDRALVDAYPFLLEPLAWAAFVEGRGADMEGYLDRYFRLLPKIILQNPASAQTSVLVRCMDYRNDLVALMRSLKKLPLKLFAQANTPSLSQNLPLFHRSARDYVCDFMYNFEDGLRVLKKTVGVLLGGEYTVIEALLRAGILYERGDLDAAYEFVLSAGAAVRDGLAPETQFCVFMIHAAVLEAQGHRGDALKILDAAEAMIERHKAYYLNANFRAFRCRLMLSDGDATAAREWLRHDAAPPHGALPFYKLYQHFTTARAYITAGDFNMAILFLKKLQTLCEQYHRPLDVIETNLLLAVAYWKRGRGPQSAFPFLEAAIVSARLYGFTQVFANEGAEISSMLHKLQKRAMQGHAGDVSAAEIKSLYVLTLAQARQSHALPGGRTPGDLTFTERQKTVMRHLNNGLTQKEIGERMGLKTSAVKSHTILIYKKLDVSSGVDAVIKMRELGLLDEP